jgi:hypothetical protein
MDRTELAKFLRARRALSGDTETLADGLTRYTAD